MHSAYHTLQAVARDLATVLPGCAITAAYSQERGEAVFLLGGSQRHLVVSCRPELLCCYLHNAVARARHNAADVLPELAGRRILTVDIHPGDRVLNLHLSGDLSLHVLLFGSKANVVLTTPEGIITDAFKHARNLVGQPLALAPPAHVLTPVELIHSLRALDGMTLGPALKRLAPHYVPIVIRELLHRAGCSSEMPVTSLSAAATAALLDASAAIDGELAHPSPRIYLRDSPLHFSIIPLTVLAPCKEERFEDIHLALQTFVAWKRSSGHFAQERLALEHRLQQLHEHARRIVAAIDADLAQGDRASRYQLYAELLLQHLSEIPPGSSTATLPSPDGLVTIPLSPGLSPSQGAQRYFEKAKASRRAHQLAERRRSVYSARADHFAALRMELDHVTARQELKAFMDRHGNDVRGHAESVPADDQERPLFRVFRVEGGFEVWAGKTSANNDALTLRHAKPQDFWFHARGVSGSHVILRVATGKGEPGKQAIRQAASIAAYYSKMRTASLAPVAVTRRKYVHKPKGAPPGTVVLQREEVLMVEPKLPDQHEASDE